MLMFFVYLFLPNKKFLCLKMVENEKSTIELFVYWGRVLNSIRDRPTRLNFSHEKRLSSSNSLSNFF